MPLNDKNSGDAQQPDAPVYQPILHKPKKDYTLIRNIALAFAILLIIAGAIYFTYREWLGSGHGVPQQEIRLSDDLAGPAVIEQQIPETASERIGMGEGKAGDGASLDTGSTPVMKDDQSVRSAKKPEVKRIVDDLSGKFTIYVASFADSDNAQRRAHEWEREGFSARVVEARGRFRVAIGRFKTEPSARDFVSENAARFGKEYWISKTAN